MLGMKLLSSDASWLGSIPKSYARMAAVTRYVDGVDAS
jgi:hypothetical protein